MIKCKIHTAASLPEDDEDKDDESGNEHASADGSKSGNPETAGTSNQPSSRETMINEKNKEGDDSIINFDAEPEDRVKKNNADAPGDSQK